MVQEFSESQRIVYYDTEITGCVGIGKLVDMMMLISEDHSASVGVTNEKVQSYGLGWVVTQHIVDITRLPKANEIVKITTKAENYNPFFCYRNFWVYDENGKELAKMHSVFVLMDQTKRKITRMQPELIEPFEAEYTKKIERLPLPKGPTVPDKKQEYKVRFMDIDANQHVNNVHYFDWMLDSLGADFLKTHTLKHMNIQYKQEIYYGQTAISEAQVDGVNTYHEIRVDDNPNCVAECLWTNN